MLRTALVLAGACLAGVTTSLPAQQPQPIGRPLLEYAEPFSTVTGLRELSDGRVIVSDAREKLIQLIDLRANRATKVGREGSGPGEYAVAGPLFALPNDQTLLIDLGNLRFLRIGADGKPIESVAPPQLPTPEPAAGGARVQGPGGLLGRLFNPRAVDAQGRLYFQPMVFSIGDAPPADSVPIIRWTIGSSRVDSVGWVRVPPSAAPTVTRVGGGTQVRATFGGAAGNVVWGPAETWNVAPDGRIARVSPEPYQVTWFGTNRRGSAGPAVPYTPIRVTEADKEDYRERMRSAPRQMISIGGAGVSTSSAPPPQVQMPEVTFAETMPPFWQQTSVVVSPDGEVWVLRTRPARDKTPVYDVFDASGRLARKVALPVDTRLVGFGKESVYLVRRDADDLEYLQKYSRPAVGQP